MVATVGGRGVQKAVARHHADPSWTCTETLIRRRDDATRDGTRRAAVRRGPESQSLKMGTRSLVLQNQTIQLDAHPHLGAGHIGPATQPSLPGEGPPVQELAQCDEHHWHSVAAHSRGSGIPPETFSADTVL